MKRILFGLFLYCVSSISAQAVHYYARKHSAVQAPRAFFNSLDEASLARAQENAAFNAIVLVLGQNEHGTGILIEPPASREDLRGKLVLTAAHVILKNKSALAVHPTGYMLGQDREDPLDEIIAPEDVIAHEGFKMGNDTTRQFDYGLVILSKPIEGIRPLHLPEAGSLTPDFSSPLIEIVGFGGRYDHNEESQGKVDEGLQKRFFHSHLNKNYLAEEGKNMLGLNVEEFVADKEKEVFTFPFSGDSGGPIFIPGRHAEVLGIVSGIDSKNEYKYIHVTRADVESLLSSRK